MKQDIHIIDDDEEVRQSLAGLIEALGYSVFAHERGDTFLEEISDFDRICILLDIRMPGRDGMEILEIIRRQSGSAYIIMMTGHGDIPLAVKAIQNGANEFIEKPFETNVIKALLEKSQIAINSRQPLEKLTPREKEIANLLSQGHANKEIAFQLGISRRTVEVHRGRLMMKLGISSPAELVRLILSK